MKLKFQALFSAEPDLSGGGAPPATPAAPPLGTPPAAATPAPQADITPPADVTPPSIGPNGELSENWFLQLGDKFSTAGDDLGKHKNISTLIEERDYFRSKQIGLPGEEATPADVSAYRQRLGIPEAGTAEAYGLDLEGVSDEEKASFDRIAAAFHGKHATGPQAFQAAIQEFKAIQAEEMLQWQDQQAKAQQESQQQLLTEWRGDFDANTSTVRHISSVLAGAAGIAPDDPAVQTLANTPAFAKIMLEVSKLTSEDGTRSPAGMHDLRSDQQRAAAIIDGTDPQWGQKYQEGDIAAYNAVVALRKNINK